MNYGPPPEPWEDERKREEAEPFRRAVVRITGAVLMNLLAAALIIVAIGYCHQRWGN